MARAFALTSVVAAGMIARMDMDSLHDLFAGLGPVTIRRLFGGKGIYHQGVIIAVEIRGALMLKVDKESAADFADAGCMQWSYVGSRHGKTVTMPYWSVPDDAMDNPDHGALGAEGVRGSAQNREVTFRLCPALS